MIAHMLYDTLFHRLYKYLLIFIEVLSLVLVVVLLSCTKPKNTYVQVVEGGTLVTFVSDLLQLQDLA